MRHRFHPWPPRRWWIYGVPPWWAHGVPFWGACAPPAPSAKMELAALKAQAEWLKGQLEAISQRIRELEAEEGS